MKVSRWLVTCMAATRTAQAFILLFPYIDVAFVAPIEIFCRYFTGLRNTDQDWWMSLYKSSFDSLKWLQLNYSTKDVHDTECQSKPQTTRQRPLYTYAAVFISFLAKRDATFGYNGMANPFVCLSVVCDVRALYSGGLTFRGYFWPSGNSPTKNHEDRPRASNARG